MISFKVVRCIVIIKANIGAFLVGALIESYVCKISWACGKKVVQDILVIGVPMVSLILLPGEG